VALKFGADMVAFPSRSLPVLSYFFQTILTSSLIVMFYTDTSSLRAVGIIGTFLVLLPVCMILYITTGARFTAMYMPRASIPSGAGDTPPANVLGSFVAFIKFREGKWTDSVGDPGYCKKCSAYFKSYVAPYQNSLVVEFILSMFFAVLNFQLIQSVNHCQALNGILFGLLVFHLFFLLWFKPLCKVLDSHLTITSTVLQVVIAMFAWIISMMDSSLDDKRGSTSVALERAASILLVLSNIVTFIKTATSSLSRFQSIGKWIQKKLSKLMSKGSGGKDATAGEASDHPLKELGEPLVGGSSSVDEEMAIYLELMDRREATVPPISVPEDIAAPPSTNPIEHELWDI